MKRIESISNSASELEEKLETVNEKMEAKTSGSGGDEAGGALFRLKDAIKNIKGETGNMELRIGLLSSDLTTKRARRVKELLQSQRSKARARQASKGHVDALKYESDSIFDLADLDD